MSKLNRFIMTLALLIAAVSGAWAGEETLLTTITGAGSNTNPATSANVSYSTEGVATLTFSEPTVDGQVAYFVSPAWGWCGYAITLTVTPAEGYTITKCIFYDDGNHTATDSEAPFIVETVFDDKTPKVNGTILADNSKGITKIEVYGYQSEPEITEWELKPDMETGKNWFLADMPASDIELQVEYEPTKVTMAANDNTMGTVEVGGESKVEWTADTWAGWTYSTKEYTVDDITMTSTNSAYINELTEAGKYLHSLNFYVDQTDDNSTVTFSTTGDPFSRIEFTMIDDYAEDHLVSNRWVGNPVIMPKDNWTFSGKSAVWEGEATKSLTLQSCTTQVSKITFFKGAVPDGVTVNGDGTFTVAKTATVTLTATPKEGYKFLYWADDQTNTNPVREVTIESGLADKTYTAVFEEITYNVTFANGIEEADKWSATPNTNVKKETKVDVKYNGAKKVLGMKVAKKSESLIVNPVVGQIIGSDGKNYDANATLPDGVTAVAVIAYVGSETGDDTYKNGLAIALADEADSNWSTAKSTCEGKTAITGAKWCLPSQDQWKQMFKANGGNNARYTGLNTTITTAGGTALKTENGDYWSSSEEDPGVLAYRVNLDDGDADWYSGSEGSNRQVRACLAF